MLTKARLEVVLAAMAAAVLIGGCAERTNREDFTSLLRNKTEQEVAKIAGKPAEVRTLDPKHVVWIYKARTFDVATRQADPHTTVTFAPGDDGKLHVAQIRFEER